VPVPAPRWVLAYYPAPIFCDAIQHMTWDWHASIVQLNVAQPAFVAVYLLQFFENKAKWCSTSIIINKLGYFKILIENYTKIRGFVAATVLYLMYCTC
jgi:hypothetical protein